MHPRSDLDRALALAATGLTASEIGRRLAIPRRTVCDWLNGKVPAPRTPPPVLTPADLITPANGPDYCYVLGIYLGDGHVSPLPRGASRLRIALDSRYPGIIETTRACIQQVVPGHRVGVYPHSSWNMVTVSSYFRGWPVLLPQMGPGPKHAREIRLRAWQTKLTCAHPAELVRGLIHSDGCRFTANQWSKGHLYSYSRYMFSNRSREIIEILCDHLDLLDVAWTRSSAVHVQIARRDAVRRLDRFVGPKF
jgi:hypothetical protein